MTAQGKVVERLIGYLTPVIFTMKHIWLVATQQSLAPLKACFRKAKNRYLLFQTFFSDFSAQLISVNSKINKK